MKINFRQASVYVILLFAQAASSFLLLPFFLRYLSAADFGKYTLTMSISILFQFLSGFSIADAVPTFFYRNNEGQNQKQKFISSVLFFTLVSAFFLLLALLLLGDILFTYIISSGFSFWDHGIYSVVIGILSSFIVPYQYYLRNSREQKKFVFLTLLSLMTGLLFQGIVLLETNLGLNGCYYAKIFSLFLPFLFIVLDCKLFSSPTFSYAIIRPLLSYSLVTMPVGILKWFTSYADRFFIEKYFLSETVAVYGVLSSIALVGQFFFLTLGQAIQPDIFEDYSKQERKNINYNNSNYNYIFIPTIIVLFLLLLLSLIIEYFTINSLYYSIKYYIPFFLISILIELYTYKFVFILTFARKPRPLLLSSLIGAFVSGVCYFTIIPYMGIFGAILILIINNLIRLGITIHYAKGFMKDYSFLGEMNTFIPVVLFFLTLTFVGIYSKNVFNSIVLLGSLILISFYLVKNREIFKVFFARKNFKLQ